MILLDGNWTGRDLWVVIPAAILLLLCAYYFLRWLHGSRNYRDDSDDHLKGCADAAGCGCMGCASPFMLAVLVVLVLFP